MPQKNRQYAYHEISLEIKLTVVDNRSSCNEPIKKHTELYCKTKFRTYKRKLSINEYPVHHKMRPQRGDLTVGAQLQIVTKHNQGESLVNLPRPHTVQPEIVQRIILYESRLERVHKARVQRRHLLLGYELRVLHLLDGGTTLKSFRGQFEFFYRTLRRIRQSRAKLLAVEKK